jgi:hypothetical protein
MRPTQPSVPDPAAFKAAVEQYPKERIRLRNCALAMVEHKQKCL